jgi:DNA-binding beta-propeller fold protein YncE
VRTVSVGAYPEGTAFDTMYIWVLNNQAGSVTKILASSGVVIGTYPIASGSSLSSVGFDGGNIWVLDTAAALLHKM